MYRHDLEFNAAIESETFRLQDLKKVYTKNLAVSAVQYGEAEQQFLPLKAELERLEMELEVLRLEKVEKKRRELEVLNKNEVASRLIVQLRKDLEIEKNRHKMVIESTGRYENFKMKQATTKNAPQLFFSSTN